MTAPAGEGLVFRALASPHRRRILDELAGGPRTTSELEQRLAPLSRFGVMQHLAVLEDAGLVLVRRSGRARFNHLNAVPFQRAYERWVSRLAGKSAASMLALERAVAADKEGDMASKARSIHIESEIAVDASPERVWRALVAEQRDWYPYTYGGDRVHAVTCEEFVGGRFFEDWGDGRGYLYGHVAEWEPPRSLAFRGMLEPAITQDQRFTIEATDDGSVLRQRLVVFGDISDQMAEGIATHGDLSRFAAQLRAWCERGVRATP